MTDEHFERHLARLAEDGVPAGTNLWPRIKARLLARRTARSIHPRPFLDLKGPETMKPTSTPARALRLAGVTSLALALLAAAVLVTPQGRALAQSVWQLFTPAQTETFAVPADMGQPAPEGMPTAVSPEYDLGNCAEGDLACQVSHAEELAGFDALAPAGDIPGLSFFRAVWDPALQEIRLEYTAEGLGSHLMLTARRGLADDMRWDQIAPSAEVQPVTVNGAAGEYVEGTYVVLPGASEATWQPNAPNQRLRWQVGEMVYEIEKLGDVEPVEYLDQGGLIALAESLE
jgi:hypothetical protein